MKAKVTQFMRPNGRQVQRELEIDDKCEPNYNRLTELGARLTCEQLMTGQVSQTIKTEECDFDIIVTKGGDLEENKKALEDMILRLDATKLEEVIEQQLA